MTDIEFENCLNELDLRLFERIPSQSTDDDKLSLLALQLAVREKAGEYVYLEIGSYLGGSIQPHLLDPKCRRIYSIDKRPASQPDARGFEWKYNNNSTKRMLDMLKGVSDATEKIVTIDGDTRNALKKADEKVDLCFIDGEHTDAAVVSDFRFCLEAVKGRGVIVFHDS
ncbi:MAG: class I SAM-dependent methyltransferase, partial [Pyrinomonadaceae bacterium]